MTKKQYATLFKERVEALRESERKMIYLGTEPPTAEFLGHVFVDIYKEIKAKRNDDTIKRIFRECRLDLDNPFHWVYALRLFCDLHYGRKQTTEWKRTPQFMATLQQDRAEILKKIPGATQLKQAERMIAAFPERYGRYEDANSLRRLFAHKVRTGRKSTKKPDLTTL